MRRLLSAAAVAILGCAAAGCRTTSAPPPKTAAVAASAAPTRPGAAPPSFLVSHRQDNTAILVVPETASDDEVAALVWQLRDAARAHSFDQLHIPQAWVDARAPKVFFHIYRGAKCATETYGKGPYPCGASYHGAGDFSFGGFSDPNSTSGSLADAAGNPKPLWNQ